MLHGALRGPLSPARKLAFATCIAALSPSIGCSIVLDFEPLPDAAIIVVEAECLEGEPNDTPGTAAPIASGTPIVAGICTGSQIDIDYFEFSLTVPSRAIIELTFENGNSTGDLGLNLYQNQQPAPLDFSNGLTDTEQIERDLNLVDISYQIEIFGTNSANASHYTLTLDLTPL